jgi:putative transposase
MARLPRLYAPGIPQLAHVEFAQAFADAVVSNPAVELDRLLAWLQTEARQHKVTVHGWLLLNDRLALLATPAAADSLPRLMQALGRRFATHLRHGRVFAGRYRSALVEPGRWILPALIWLESLPVQLKYVEHAENWPWSSASFHSGNDTTNANWTVDHADFWQNGNTPFARQAAYVLRLHDGLSSSENERIQQALFGQWALGGDDFLIRLKGVSNRRLAPAQRGRPKKAAAARPAPVSALD